MFRHLSIGHLLINERKSQSKNEKSRDDRIEGQQITKSLANISNQFIEDLDLIYKLKTILKLNKPFKINP